MPAHAEALVWDGNCGINLANYLTDRKEKIGIVAKGCDSRNIVTHIIENKISAISCISSASPAPGMIDRARSRPGPGEIEAFVEDEAKTVTVSRGGLQSKRFDRADVLQDNCACACTGTR
jgi:formate dehydrogenase (coenzyme F420) beta subunit